MASISEVQRGIDAPVEPPPAQEPPRITTASLASDEPSRSGDPVPETQSQPDNINFERQTEDMPDTEFNRKYPPDPWGQEMAPNARVWKVYRDQQDLSHSAMLEGWNKTLDVLLIFAGLFSAVLTAFLIESYKALQPDYTQYVATFLYAAVEQHTRTGGVLPALDMLAAPDSFVQTSSAQRWTNGLWFASLVISLAVALFCILIKQWLDAYESHVSAAAPNPKHWARRHSLYHHGLKDWGVPGLISFLPLLLHLSLFLFFVGLILFVRPLDGALSYALLVMISCIAAFYLLSLVLPACLIECPTYTPLLAQTLLAVSRAISGLIYVVSPLESTGLEQNLRLSSRKLSCFIGHAKRWLESIQPLRQLAREIQSVSYRDQELDGHVLTALIQQAVDTDGDAVNAGFAAIGAVTSTRTIEVISRQVSREDIYHKVIGCETRIRWTETGFSITSRAQLHRALAAMWIQNASRWGYKLTPPHIRGLRSRFNIDGLLLEAVDFDDTSGQLDIDSLIHPLQSRLLDGSFPRMLPLRSTCLIVLEQFSRRPYAKPSFLSCFLLVFCAGNFADAAPHEVTRALQTVATVLRTHCFITMPAHGTREVDNLCAVLNGLWIMLADPSRYDIDILTAQIFSDAVVRCYHRFSDHPFTWAQLWGLCTFLHSPTISQCVGARGRLDHYISVFRYLTWSIAYADRTLEYWTCIAILLQLCWRTARRTQVGDYLARDAYLFELVFRNYPVRLIQSGLYATLDDWYEPALSAFLTGGYAIATWTDASSPDLDDQSIDGLAALAYRISIVLCRRQRLVRANDNFVQGFFSGSFLFARFRDFISREHISTEYEPRFEQVVLDLAKHCLKLSPAACMDICTQLEQLGEEGSELRARAVAFAERMRTPDDALSAPCDSDCPCMTESVRAKRGLRDTWSDMVARFRRGRTESTTAAPV